MIYIYQIYCIENNKAYVGQTNDITQRLSRHRSLLKQNKHFNSHLQNCFNKYGLESFKFEILNIVDTREESNDQELFWITSYNNIGLSLNKTNTITIYSRTQETRSKISKALKGRNIHWKDKIRKTILEDTDSMNRIRDLGLSRKGKTYINRKGIKGRVMSYQQKVLLSKSNNFIPFHVISPDGVTYYVETLKQFCREHGLDQSCLRKVKNGILKHHKGWRKLVLDKGE